jgi:hypothetical protein
VVVADILEQDLAKAAARYGFRTAVLPESGELPFQTGEFDVAFCSSVIEHVTIPKGDVWRVTSGKAFREGARAAQRAFANEIRRVGRYYFVQTPNRGFPIESHTWLPLIAVLPRPLLLRFLRATNSFWIKKTNPDWYLLSRRELQSLFPEAQVLEERVGPFVKSIMAVKNP